MSATNKLTADLLIQIPKRFPQCRVWRNNRVDAMVTGSGGKIRRVQAGVNGQADITGIMQVDMGHDLRCLQPGLRLEIEVKTGRDRQSREQKAFEKMIMDLGGVYIVARDLEQTLEELGRWV